MRLFILTLTLYVTFAQAKTLPSLHYTTNNSGQIALSSLDQRFIFTGQLYDKWSGQFIRDFDSFRRAAKTIHFDKLPFDFDSLSAFRFGLDDSKLIAYIFFDPTCPACNQLFSSLPQPIDGHYVLIPIATGKNSVPYLKALACANTHDEAINAILSGTYEGLHLIPQALCDSTSPGLVDSWLQASQVLGIQQVPFFVRADGTTRAGLSNDFFEWVNQ